MERIEGLKRVGRRRDVYAKIADNRKAQHTDENKISHVRPFPWLAPAEEREWISVPRLARRYKSAGALTRAFCPDRTR